MYVMLFSWLLFDFISGICSLECICEISGLSTVFLLNAISFISLFCRFFIVGYISVNCTSCSADSLDYVFNEPYLLILLFSVLDYIFNGLYLLFCRFSVVDYVFNGLYLLFCRFSVVDYVFNGPYLLFVSLLLKLFYLKKCNLSMRFLKIIN